MKRFTDFIHLPDQELLESPMRTAGAAALTLKINNLKNQIIQQKYQPSDDLEHNLQRVSLKLELVAQQNYFLGLLVSQINLMK